MNSRTEKLMIRLDLLDGASSKFGKILNGFNAFEKDIDRGVNNIKNGVIGLFSTGATLTNLLQPAIDMTRALGEVQSLGVADDVLQNLERTALKTSIQYGISAADMVRSSYDIQSAIGGLEGNELATFTKSSNILALGTKSDAATITNYMGTMYGIFKNSADAMGKARWVEQLTGQTAAAVKMFKTTGAEMAGAFTSLGAEAQSAGIGLSEQIGILGTLQATMSGSEAGTKYRAFLAGVGNAQKQLGLEFTDSQGRLLPMVNILEKLRGKFGETFDVAESDALKKAFGSTEATGLIKLLMSDLGGLSKSIKDINNITGQTNAEKMAKVMADPWERLSAAVTATKTVIGRVIQPVLIPFIETIINGSQAVSDWSERHPKLTKVIGVGILAFIGIAAAVSAFAVATGITQLALTGLGPVLKVARAGVLLFNSAILLNPIAWLVLGIGAAGYAIYKLIDNFDAVKSSVVDFFTTGYNKWQEFRSGIEKNIFLTALFSPLFTVIDVVTFTIGVLNKIPQWWQATKDYFSTFNLFEFLSDAPVLIQTLLLKGLGFFMDFRSNMKSVLENNRFLRTIFSPLLAGIKVIDFVAEKISMVPEYLNNARDYVSSIDILGGLKNSALTVFNFFHEKWNLLESTIRNNGFLSFAFAPLLAAVDIVRFAIKQFEKLPEWWGGLRGRLAALNPFGDIDSKINFILNKINLLPGVNLSVSDLQRGESAEVNKLNAVEPPDILVKNTVPDNGLISQVTNSGVHIERLEVNSSQSVNGFNLYDELMRAGG